MPNDNSDEELKHGTPRKDDKSADAQDSDILTSKADHPDVADTESAKINLDELEANLARLCAKKVIDEHQFKLLRKNWESCSEDDFLRFKTKETNPDSGWSIPRYAIHKQISSQKCCENCCISSTSSKRLFSTASCKTLCSISRKPKT
ncbi:MAG: hypothetical protein ACNYPI_12095 [Arenicellales bacterium WSBS_2016_MAG_OTU3]